jgi:hypothetical protein
MLLEAPQDHQSAKKLVSLWFSDAFELNSLLVLDFHPQWLLMCHQRYYWKEQGWPQSMPAIHCPLL